MATRVEHDDVEVGGQGGREPGPTQAIVGKAMGKHQRGSRASSAMKREMSARDLHGPGLP